MAETKNALELVNEWVGTYLGNRVFASITLRPEQFGDIAQAGCLNLYTSEYRYRISWNAEGTYIGGQAEARKELPGENWKRGNDLHDGPFSEITFIKILLDILAYELEPATRIPIQAEINYRSGFRPLSAEHVASLCPNIAGANPAILTNEIDSRKKELNDDAMIVYHLTRPGHRAGENE